jgi:hypothetical protein
MKLKSWLLVTILCAVSLAADAPKGTTPRTTAGSYPSHLQMPSVGVGAMLLSHKQERQTFGLELGDCCVIVEVAIYPPKDDAVKVSFRDFRLINEGKDVGFAPSDPEVVASLLPEKSTIVERDQQTGLHTHSNVGYQSGGYDPATGQRRPGGVVTSGGAGVGVGNAPTSPGTMPLDRHSMELLFANKELQEGTATAPVSGYLYFSIPDKHDRNAHHQLQCTLNGEKIVLPLDK